MKLKKYTLKLVLAAAVGGDSILKEGEATYGAHQPISLGAAPTKWSRFLIKESLSNWQTHCKSKAREVELLLVSPCSNYSLTQKPQKNH